MAPLPRVVQWLDEYFQKPRIDPEWLEGCTEWLEGEQNISPVSDFPEFMERVKGQLLESDLIDSMLPGTGLDAHTSTMSGCISGPPVLVQISAITEIGSSAFQLDQIRLAREDRISAGVGNEEGEEEGDIEVEGEGPMPKFPRGVLRFQLTDGAISIQAIEYRHIPQFTLGTTPLGFKMQLKGTKFQNGMAMLEPTTIILLGGKQAELEANQNVDFKRGLYARLGRPLTPVSNNAHRMEQDQAMTLVSATTVPRSPLRDISPPRLASDSQHEDDVEMEPRRRLPTNFSSIRDPPSSSENIANHSHDRPIARLPSRQRRASPEDVSDHADINAQMQRRTPMAERATLVFAGSQPKTRTTSTHFEGNATTSATRLQSRELNSVVDGLDFNFEPTGRQLARTLPSPNYFQPSVADDSFDFALLDEVDQESHLPVLPNKGKGRQDGSISCAPVMIHDDASSDDYGMDDFNDLDPSFLNECDKIEKIAVTKIVSTNSLSSITTSYIPDANSSLSAPHVLDTTSSSFVPRTIDVIEIDDSDDEVSEADDKENAPVATRHVRRRIEIGAQPQSQNPRSQDIRKKTGQPIVLATNPDDIIDLSDSD